MQYYDFEWRYAVSFRTKNKYLEAWSNDGVFKK